MPETTEIIRVNEAQSVQRLPNAVNGSSMGNVTRLWGGVSYRGPLLPRHGTREREYKLLQFYRNDYNLLYKAGIAGFIKRVQSTPYEIKGLPERADFFHDILSNADFGRGFDSFLSKLLIDYSRYDAGGYIELIGRGDPAQAIAGNVTGLAVLDSLRCMPTGDPNYPVIYMDIGGNLHLLHHSRVVRFFDNAETSEEAYGYGECSLSRCISAVSRDIYVNRYVERNLDDNPPPGLAVFKNLTDDRVKAAVENMQKEQNTDYGSVWGRVIRLYGLQTETMPEVNFVSFSSPPEKFDLEKYKNLNVKEIALGIGLDIQDMWELSGGNIGSATQSEILHQKSKGRALGRVLKGLERIINTHVLPDDLEFTFKYTDKDEDKQEAEKAQIWSNVALSLKEFLPQEAIQQLLANQLESIRDVITDEMGIVRLDDSDPKTPEQAQPLKVPDKPMQTEQPNEDVVVEEKQLSNTQQSFRQAFIGITKLAKMGAMPPAAVRLALRAELQSHGEKAYLDGLNDGGSEEKALSKEGVTAVATWRAQQQPFIDTFTTKLFSDDVEISALASRAEMWVNKSLNPIYYKGLGEANSQARYLWIVDPKKEHCDTCLKLNGQVHRMKAYIDANMLPQSETLDCGGYNCGCKLVKTDLPARGSISRQSGGLFNFVQRLANAARRFLRG